MRNSNHAGFSHSLLAVAIVVGLLIAAIGYRVVARGTSPPANPPASASLVSSNCSAVWVGGNQMIYNQRQASGLMTAYVGDTKCQNGHPLVADTDGNVGASSVSSDGRYVMLEEAFGATKQQAASQVGVGIGDQLVLLDRQTGRLSQLTSGGLATIWATMNDSGNQVTWSSMLKMPAASGNIFQYALGIWQLNVADITPQGTLANIRSYQVASDPGFYETYGFYGNNILFASDVGVHAKVGQAHWLTAQDWMINDSLTSGVQPTRISQPLPAAGNSQNNVYHEFMHLAPAGTFAGSNSWIIGSVTYQSGLGMDLWRFRPDGSGMQRLTYFNGYVPGLLARSVKGFPTPRLSIPGQIAIDPAHPKVIYVSVIHNLVQNATAAPSQLWQLHLN